MFVKFLQGQSRQGRHERFMILRRWKIERKETVMKEKGEGKEERESSVGKGNYNVRKLQRERTQRRKDSMQREGRRWVLLLTC